MKKTILIGMLLVLCVSMVSSATTHNYGIRARKGKLGLGDEMLTCWDFDCSDGWINLDPSLEEGWYWLASTAAEHWTQFAYEDSGDNISQNIVIVPNKVYSVEINVHDVTVGINALYFYLGGVKTHVFTNLNADGDTIFSYQITADTSDGLFVEGWSGSGYKLILNSVSVKEKLPTTVELGKRKFSTNWFINFIFRA